MHNIFSIHEAAVFDWRIRFFDFGNVSLSSSLYIQGQLHSNEVNSFTTLYSLIERLKNNPPPIPVRIIPCCNPIGWETYLQGNDGRVSNPSKLDWNRIFKNVPIENGTIEMELASVLWKLSKGFNQVIDVHTPDYGFPHVYTIDINKRLLTFDDLPYVTTNEITDGSFQNLHYKEGTASTFTLELPSYDVWTLVSQEYWADRIFEEIISNKKNKIGLSQGKPKYFGKIVNLYSNISGVPILIARPNEIAKANSDIVKVLSSSGESEIISFEKDCIPLCFRRRGIIQAGRMVTRVLSVNHGE